MTPTAQRVLAVSAVVVVALVVGARWRLAHSRRHPSSIDANKPRQDIHVLHVTQPLTLDGELTETPWHTTPLTKFKQNGKESRPYNDVRFLWSSDGILHVGLYASDLNIVSSGKGPVSEGDAFHVVFLPPPGTDGEERSFWVGPTADGGVVDGVATSGVRFKIDMDEGTVDDKKEADEEWVVEMEIPLASLGLKPEAGQRIDVVASRCDVDKAAGPPLETPCPETDRLGLIFDP